MAQESWKRDTDETGCQPPEGPSLCANNCGFFGSSSTMNFCSKCYRDLVLKQAKASSTVSMVEKSCALKIEQSVEVADQSVRPAIVAQGEGTSSGEHQKQPANRCSSCKKRIGLTGFKCRCGDTFCSLHRYSDKHNCPFDYRKAGQDAIAKANPVVKAEKIDKI
eukprot:Gb_24628 [translate_table: standard]